MTVTYTAEVATCRGFGCFIALLLRWKGSIYKLVWPDLFAFLSLYYGLRLVYLFLLDEAGKETFSEISKYFDSYSNFIPLSFVLGFYISIIMQRWWDQYLSIPWPDPIAVFVSAHIHGQDDRGRLMRRTIMRYVCLCLSMVFSMICPRVKKRFPTLEHFVDAGLMTENEKSIVKDLNDQFPRHSKHWLPIVWAASIVTRARKEGRIRDDFAVKTIIDELNKFRGQCGRLLNYDSISVPLVYTQVVTLATYSFVITSAIGRQWHVGNRNCIDQYFPVFATLQFFFYMGWLKVAESLINPFGEDDDDFEINWIVDRNVVVSYLIVDEMHHEHPELIKDQYWDEVFPTELPHTVASQPFKEKIPQPSTANIAVSNTEAEYANPTSIKTDEAYDDNQSGIHFSVRRTGSVVRPRTSSAGSNHSLAASNMGSVAASLHRINSVTSVLKRLISKDSSTTTDGIPPTRMSESISTTSLAPKTIGGGSLRIADQVIEEVDEQVTITSMANRPADIRPTAASLFESGPVTKPPTESTDRASNRDPTEALFGSHPASAPIAVPTRRTNAGLSGMSLPPTLPVSPTRSSSLRSAPPLQDTTSSGLGSGSICPVGDSISIGSSSSDEDGDEFQRLKASRRREMERIMLARSISAIADSNRLSPTEDMALIDVSTDSQTTLLRSDYDKK